MFEAKDVCLKEKQKLPGSILSHVKIFTDFVPRFEPQLSHIVEAIIPQKHYTSAIKHIIEILYHSKAN